jgi:hypothetical protein
MWRLAALAFLIGVFFVVVSGPMACGPSGSAGMQCTDPAAYPENGSMVTASEGSGCGNLPGTVAPGAACMGPNDCQPACCSCGTFASDTSIAVGYCLSTGVCAEPTVTCCAFLNEMSDQDAANRACQ